MIDQNFLIMSIRKPTSRVTESLSHNSSSPFEEMLDDVIFLILRFLKPIDLCTMCCVSKRFYSLANKDTVWHDHAKRHAVVVMRGSSSPRSHHQDCSAKMLYKVAPHWKQGLFKDKFVIKNSKRLIPWLEVDDREVWYSSGNVIRNYDMKQFGTLRENKAKTLSGMSTDATHFVLQDQRIISGSRDGGVYGWDKTGRPLFSQTGIHKGDTQCLDATHSIIVTGSRDATCKVLSSQAPQVLKTFDVGERVWSVKISPSGREFGAGLAGDIIPLHLFDIETGACTGSLGEDHRKGAGVLDLKFESPHLLLSCGYDTILRLWDLRTLTCVNQWEEPHDSALYCLRTDASHSMIVGTARHGMARLWDKRHTQPVQAYYSYRCHSPVYSLAMDYGHLYLALDMGLNLMDFVSGQTRSKTPTSPHSPWS